MKFRKQVAAPAVALITVLGLLTGCSGGAPSAEEAGTLTIAQSESIDSWNPQEGLLEQSFAVYPQVFASLLSTSPDGTEVVPGLATDYEFDDTANTITFHLDPDAQFSDGTPVTATDVKFSETLWAAGELYGTYFTPIQSVTVVDENTVVFNLDRADHAFLGILATANAAIVPADFAGVDAETFWKKPISAGAYAIASEEIGQSITLTRNKHFKGGTDGMPDTVKYVSVPDAAQQLLQFQSGKVDVVNNIQLDSVGQYDASALQSADSSGVVVLVFKTDVPPLDNVDFRRAVNLAIDNTALIAGGLSGLGENATSVLPQIVPGVAPCEACDWSKTDLAKAKALVKSSGYDGHAISLIAASEGGPEKLVAEALVPMLAAAGITVKFEAVASSTYDDRLENGNFEMTPIVYSALAPSAVDPLGFLAATEIIFSGASVDVANAAVEQLTSATTVEEEEAATSSFEEWAYDQQPVIPLAVPEVIYAVSKRVQGFTPNTYKAWFAKDVTLTR